MTAGRSPEAGTEGRTPEERPFARRRAEIGAIGQGTFLMEHDDPKAVVRALRVGLERGLRHVDTAELYGGGRVEELVGEALAGRRDEAFVVSKVMPHNASYQGTLAACERSLRLLGMDYLDGYLLHWPGAHPLSETLQAFDELVRAGKIRWYGVSNFDAAGLAEAVRIAGPGRIACNQILYHLAERSSEHEVIPFCEANDIAVVGYTPFGRAAFPPRRGGAVLERLAAARGVTPRQLALAYLTRRPSLFAIPKASQPSHVEENAGAAKLVLTPAELLEVEAAFPRGAPRRGVARI